MSKCTEILSLVLIDICNAEKTAAINNMLFPCFQSTDLHYPLSTDNTVSHFTFPPQ
jgi:hypothetical protein